MDRDLCFPELAVAARRLDLNETGLAESVLSAMDAGFTEREAMTMSIIETLQRRGAYHGRLKRMVDDGTIFQMEENGGSGEDLTMTTARQKGKECPFPARGCILTFPLSSSRQGRETGQFPDAGHRVRRGGPGNWQRRTLASSPMRCAGAKPLDPQNYSGMTGEKQRPHRPRYFFGIAE